MLVGLGLLIPQLSFLRWFIPYSIQTIKMMTANTYYFFVTIYYKIVRFINWFIAIPNNIKIFFTNFSFRKSQNSQEDNSSYKNNYKNEYSYNKQNKSSYEDNTNYSNSDYKEESNTNQHGEYSQFYSDSAYVVLGVSEHDDFKTIKKSYRVLVRIYHPDLNPNDIKLYTEITQNLNNAYEKLEKMHS